MQQQGGTTRTQRGVRWRTRDEPGVTKDQQWLMIMKLSSAKSIKTTLLIHRLKTADTDRNLEIHHRGLNSSVQAQIQLLTVDESNLSTSPKRALPPTQSVNLETTSNLLRHSTFPTSSSSTRRRPRPLRVSPAQRVTALNRETTATVQTRQPRLSIREVRKRKPRLPSRKALHLRSRSSSPRRKRTIARRRVSWPRASPKASGRHLKKPTSLGRPRSPSPTMLASLNYPRPKRSGPASRAARRHVRRVHIQLRRIINEPAGRRATFQICWTT